MTKYKETSRLKTESLLLIKKRVIYLCHVCANHLGSTPSVLLVGSMFEVSCPRDVVFANEECYATSQRPVDK